MKVLRWLGGVFGVLLAIAAIGQISGNQPDRDAVAAARSELGIELESRRVDVGEVTLHVVLAGPVDGPPVVLLHGFPEFWYAWRGPMAVLARAGFRVIVPDQRGYNASDKPGEVEAYGIEHLAGDIAGLIDALGYREVSLSGHDWGGGVAWRVVLDYPDKIRRFAVLDTPHPKTFDDYKSDEEAISWYRTFILLPYLPAWSARIANWALLTGSLRDTSQPGTFPEPVMDQFRSAWDRDGAMTSMGAWYRAPSSVSKNSQRVATPTLVIVAPNDAYIPGDMTRHSMDYLENGRLLELETGTHWSIQEQPEKIGKILVDFFGADPLTSNTLWSSTLARDRS